MKLLAYVLVGRLEGVGVRVPHGALHRDEPTLAADAETTVVQRVAVNLAASLLENVLPGGKRKQFLSDVGLS